MNALTEDFHIELAGAQLTREDFRRDVLAGLSRHEKTLPCKYLYDDEGARLFEEICKLEEYYPTRTELGILERNIGEIASLVGPRCRIIELGSGGGVKTQLLLEHLDHPAVYMPIDVSCSQLQEFAAKIAREHPAIEIHPICADYSSEFDMPDPSATAHSTLVFFPGSTIANLEPDDAIHFLRRISQHCGPDCGLLVGVDLKKSPAILNPAYNDSHGITAKFNLNLLTRVNRELDANFNCEQFRHNAFYDEITGRIEMHLISRRWQVVSVSGVPFSFRPGESIITEHSYKYTPNDFTRLTASAGLKASHCWTDDQNWFSVQYLTPQT